MIYVINNLRLPIQKGIFPSNQDNPSLGGGVPLYFALDELKALASKKLGVRSSDLVSFRIVKESIDARRKPDISLVYSVAASVSGTGKVRTGADLNPLEEPAEEELKPGLRAMHGRPVIVGSGPAGMFAGLVLAGCGYKPLMLERGDSIEARTAAVKSYWEQGMLDPESNVQFGEGGAGTFSDGKLTTRINDLHCGKVLEYFHSFGAGSEILYKAKPHIGSDVLKTVVANMRKRIIELGGEIRFRSKVTSLLLEGGRAAGVTVNGTERLDAGAVVLAIGHSARDTFESLLDCGVSFERKPFSIGVRIEHPQEAINLAQYGDPYIARILGAADYQLFQKIGDRTAYSFCMCPGGVVTASASEPGTVVTNGMSEYARDKENANSALVVTVGPEDFGYGSPLAGVEFQRKWERRAFEAAGGTGSAPVQLLADFMDRRVSSAFGKVQPGYTGNIRFTDLNTCLPEFVTEPMKQAVSLFDRKIRGFAMKDAVLTGVETRTSSPVRMPRGDSLEAIGISGLYPAGEGAGYAGGIMSAAVDGMRVAEQIIRTYAQP